MALIRPSVWNKWDGTPVVGSRYTAEQLRRLAHECPGRDDFDDRMVDVTWPDADQWAPPTIIPMPCPIIARTRDGRRVLVITPGGAKQWMDVEGS